MLVILNPFAQLLYLNELMNRFSPAEFIKIHFKASLLSLAVFTVFALWGDVLLKEVFQVRLPSVQIFGGLIMIVLMYRYITVGAGSNLLFRGDISELASKISLPFMVGPGTIWISILIGRKYSAPVSLSVLSGVLFVNILCVGLYHQIQFRLEKKKELSLGKYLSILMRVNALFLGAIGVEMIFRGVESMYGIISRE